MLTEQSITEQWNKLLEKYSSDDRKIKFVRDFHDLFQLTDRRSRLASVALASHPHCFANLQWQGKYAVEFAEKFADNIYRYKKDFIELNNFFGKCWDFQINREQLNLNYKDRKYHEIAGDTCRNGHHQTFSFSLHTVLNGHSLYGYQLGLGLNDITLEIILKAVLLNDVQSQHKTSTVVALARGIYNDKTFDRMPILADALQDAGYDREETLTQLRDNNSYWFRGCSILDEILDQKLNLE